MKTYRQNSIPAPIKKPSAFPTVLMKEISEKFQNHLLHSLHFKILAKRIFRHSL